MLISWFSVSLLLTVDVIIAFRTRIGLLKKAQAIGFLLCILDKHRRKLPNPEGLGAYFYELKERLP